MLSSPALPADQREKAEAIAVLFAVILWDNDFVPLDNAEGFNLGTPNMPVQQWACRNQFAVFLADQPEMAARARRAVEVTRKTFAWTRAVSVALPADDVPIIAIQDSFSGHDAAGAKVFTLNLMAEGAVETPAGRLIPTPRLWGTGIEERASAGRVVELKPGVNRLGFTGQAWPAHPTKGIECFLGVAFGAAIRQNAAMPRTLRVH